MFSIKKIYICVFDKEVYSTLFGMFFFWPYLIYVMKKKRIRKILIPKNNGVEIKRILNDASRRRSCPQDVLFGGQIIGSSNSLQVVKITATNISMQHAANTKKTQTTANNDTQVVEHIVFFF